MRKPTTQSFWIVLFLVLPIAALDQVTALWARYHVPQFHEIWLWRPTLGLQLLFNRGAALGLGSHWPLLVTVVGIVGTLVLFYLSLTAKTLRTPLAVMAGGALGNVLSRILFGTVTDFIRIAGWPGIFNLADVAIRLGGVWLVIQVLMGAKNSDTSKA